jgi:hypothetical protein
MMTKRREKYPVAETIEVGFCPDCRVYHVLLLDKREQPIAECSFSREELQDMLDEVDGEVRLLQ